MFSWSMIYRIDSYGEKGGQEIKMNIKFVIDEFILVENDTPHGFLLRNIRNRFLWEKGEGRTVKMTPDLDSATQD